MANYTAIADVGDTLVTLLRDRIAERSDVVSIDRKEIALVSPGERESDSDVRLALYLYHVTEDGSRKESGTRHIGNDRVSQPPLPLKLKFLLTAYPAQSGRDETTKATDQQRLLGLAMQVFYDYATLESDQLQGSLSQDDFVLEISLSQEGTESLTNLWNSFRDQPLQPSAVYEVSPVLIDPVTEEEIDRITEREAGIERLNEELPEKDPFGEKKEKKREGKPALDEDMEFNEDVDS